MKKTVLAAAITAASVLLVGCGPDEPSQDEVQAYVDGEAQKVVRTQVAADEAELKDALVQMQSVDPSIKDIYYSIDDKGNKVLHVVHSNSSATAPASTGSAGAQPSGGQQAVADNSVSDMVWPMVGGMAAGALAASMMKSGSLSSFSHQNPPMSNRVYREEERRRERNVATSGYVNSMMGGARNSVRSSPNFGSSMRSTVISSRSSAIFAGSSARAGGYSAGS